jgi:hypothetical protein
LIILYLKEQGCLKKIALLKQLLEEFKKDNCNEEQLKLAENKLEAAKFKFEVFENPTFLCIVDLSF